MGDRRAPREGKAWGQGMGSGSSPGSPHQLALALDRLLNLSFLTFKVVMTFLPCRVLGRSPGVMAVNISPARGSHRALQCYPYHQHHHHHPHHHQHLASSSSGVPCTDNACLSNLAEDSLRPGPCTSEQPVRAVHTAEAKSPPWLFSMHTHSASFQVHEAETSPAWR